MPKQKQTAQPKEAAHFLPLDHTKLTEEEFLRGVAEKLGPLEVMDRGASTMWTWKRLFAADPAAAQKTLAAEAKARRGWETPHAASIRIGNDTSSRLAAAAQFLGLHSRDELAQIVLLAFLEMYDDDHWITFPLMLQQVDTMQ